MNLPLLESAFARNFSLRGEVGASLSVWQGGREVVSLAGGHRDRERTLPWVAKTSVLVWSATKGPAAGCLLHACQQHGVALGSRVAEVWPEFAAAGKGAVTIAEVLSHRAGLPVLDEAVPVLDHAAVATALAAQPPHWSPGEAHGYHPRTFGFLLDELVRRITGAPSLGAYWREHFAEPLGLAFWIGLPPGLVDAPAAVLASRAPLPQGEEFYRALQTPGSFPARAFASPRGLHSVASMNSPEARAACLPAFGGVGTARALAKWYAVLAGDGTWDGRRYFTSATLASMRTPLVDGPDRTLLMPTAFSAGFMQDPLAPGGAKARTAFGPSPSAFGHPGAGGSLAFADPEHDLSFAYVMNQMEPGVLPGERCRELVAAVYDGQSGVRLQA